MLASTHSLDPSPANTSLHAAFLELLPKLQTHAHIYFRHVKCADKRADKVAETLALAWKWYVRLQQRGQDVSRFSMVFVFLVANFLSQ